MLKAQRAYSPAERAQRKTYKPVYSETELKAHIQACTAGGLACTVSLGADIFLHSPIVLPAALPSFSLRGEAWSIKIASTWSGNSIFSVYCGSASVYAPIVLDDVTVEALGVNALFEGGSSVYTSVRIEGCYLSGLVNIFDIGRLQYSSINNSVITATVETEIFSEAVTVQDSMFSNIAGNYAISLAVTDSVGNTFSCLNPSYVFNTYSVTSYKRNSWLGVNSNNLTYTVYDQVFGGSASFTQNVTMSPATVAVTADNQAITTTNKNIIYLASDNATAANRTITLGSGTQGQLLVLQCTSNALELADSGNCKLSAIWTAGVDDTITLLYSTSTSAWHELARSNN